MNSPPSSPDLHPPEYLQPSTSRRKATSPLPTSFSSDHGGSPPGLLLPPPAVSSMQLPSRAAYTQCSPLEQLQNQSRRLTTELQTLLDAQSAALEATTSGLSSPNSGRSSRASASNVSAASPSGRYRSKLRSKKKRIPDITTTRSNILTAMQELSTVKDRESAVYSDLSGERKELLSTIASHTTKTTRLRKELQKIDSSHDATTADSLRSETAAVASEIAALRQRLHELEVRHASMQTQLVELENVVESQSASYKAALEAVSRKTTTFLYTHNQPTPDAATETWTLEAGAFAEKAEAAEKERDALEDGMQLWASATDTIYGFESWLRARADDPSAQRDPNAVVLQLEKVGKSLEEMVKTAHDRRWKLLEVAIGAELQSHKEMTEMFKKKIAGTVPASNSPSSPVAFGDNQHGLSGNGSSSSDNNPDNGLAGLIVQEPPLLAHDYSPLDE